MRDTAANKKERARSPLAPRNLLRVRDSGNPR